MKSQDEKKIFDESYFTNSIREWHQEYQNLDKLSVKLDNIVAEINYLRGLVEQKMKDLDRFFTPPCE